MTIQDAIVHVFTGGDAWSSAPTTVDSATSFSLTSDTIRLNTATNEYTSVSQTVGPCRVDVSTDGAGTVSLGCDPVTIVVPAQRLWFNEGLSSLEHPAPLPGVLVSSAHSAGYAELFLDNDYVEIHHSVVRSDGRVLHGNTGSPSPPIVRENELLPTHDPSCAWPMTYTFTYRMRTPDGWLDEDVHELPC